MDLPLCCEYFSLEPPNRTLHLACTTLSKRTLHVEALTEQGGVLILIAIRSILWYRPIGLSHYLAHALQITAGLGLSLLGLLDIGSKHIGGDDTTGNFGKTNDLYRLVSRRAPLAIILGVYAGVYYGGLLGVSLMGRCRRKSQAGEGV